MKVLWLRDGKAGHRNKAKGLLRAIGQLTDIDIAEYDLEWRLPIISGFVNLNAFFFK